MDAHTTSYSVAAEDVGATIDELAARLLGAAGGLAVARGGAWLDGRRVGHGEERPAAGARLELRHPPQGGYRDVSLAPADIAYEDAWLLIVHKRAGWYVGATPWDAQGNVLAALGRMLAARDGLAPPLHLAHQLDRDTSGLLLVSRHPAANAPLQAAFAGGRVAKRYLTLCAGAPPESGELRTGHGRAAGGRWRIYPADEVGRALPGGGGRVKEARTGYRVLRYLRGAALVEATPHTGRTHQIRLHLAYLGHPLLGDARYGGPGSYLGLELPGHMLHAAALGLDHPLGGGRIELASPAPELFDAILSLGAAQPAGEVAAEGAEQAADAAADDEDARLSHNARVEHHAGQDGGDADEQAVEREALAGRPTRHEAAHTGEEQEEQQEEQVERVGEGGRGEEVAEAEQAQDQLEDQADREIH